MLSGAAAAMSHQVILQKRTEAVTAASLSHCPTTCAWCYFFPQASPCSPFTLILDVSLLHALGQEPMSHKFIWSSRTFGGNGASANRGSGLQSGSAILVQNAGLG